MNKKWQIAKCIFFDFVGVALAWIVFALAMNKRVELSIYGKISSFTSMRFFVAMALFILFWIILFILAGFYNDVFRKSRLKELGNSIGITVIGTIFIFFILLHDYISPENSTFRIFNSMFFLVFALTYFPRLILTSITIHKIHNRKWGYPTIIIGDGEKALELYNELQAQVKSQGYKIIGYINVGTKPEQYLSGVLPNLGDIRNINQIIKTYHIEEVLLALDKIDSKGMVKLINELLYLNVMVKAIPSLYDYLTGRVKMSEIFSAPLFRISFELMAPWQVKTKQIIDFVVAALALIFLLPLIIVLCILIKINSKGPIFHFQERIGQYGKPFTLYKFRSMKVNAESSGPMLSSKSDGRVTPLGRFMRKTRLDEIPNFVNVLKGEMSLVGPRPERQFYIDQIVKIAPHYIHLQKVKPGITSWGQVKYGYAENVDQMVERLKYDILYIENMSIVVDLKIIIYTLITVFKGKGV